MIQENQKDADTAVTHQDGVSTGDLRWLGRRPKLPAQLSSAFQDLRFARVRKAKAGQESVQAPDSRADLGAPIVRTVVIDEANVFREYPLDRFGATFGIMLVEYVEQYRTRQRSDLFDMGKSACHSCILP